MELIKITGSDKLCEISGENFSYTFENGHPVKIIKNSINQDAVPYPKNNSKNMKSKTLLVHKYWDSALVITKYFNVFSSFRVKYHIFSNGDMKQETIC